MRILVDADGCPVVDISIRIAKDYNLEIVIVKNHAHHISDSYAEIVSVDISRDSADFYIVNNVRENDIVITQDYGLAAMCLGKRSIPINQNGLVYSDDNIDTMLNRRHIHRELRQQGKYHGKAKKRNIQSDKTFEMNLRKLIKNKLNKKECLSMLDLLINRRSIRKYKDQKIEKDKLDKILKGALAVPSGKNVQPWELIVVEEKETLEKLAGSRGGPSKHLANAPLAIVVAANPKSTDVWVEDASIISIVIQLMAESLGLGTCWIQSRKRLTQDGQEVSEYVKGILDVPENYTVESMIAIGYPDEDREPREQNFAKVHYEKF